MFVPNVGSPYQPIQMSALAQASTKKEITEEELIQVLIGAGVELEDVSLDKFLVLLNHYGYEIAKDSPEARLPFSNPIAPGHYFGYDKNFNDPFALETEMRKDLQFGHGASPVELPIKLWYDNEEEREKVRGEQWLAAVPALLAMQQKMQQEQRAFFEAMVKEQNEAHRNRVREMAQKLTEEGNLSPDPAVNGKQLTKDEIYLLLQNEEIQPLVECVQQAIPGLEVKSGWEGTAPCGTFLQILNFTELAIDFNKERELLVNGYRTTLTFTADNCQIAPYIDSDGALHILNKDIGKEEVSDPILRRDPEFNNIWLSKSFLGYLAL